MVKTRKALAILLIGIIVFGTVLPVTAPNVTEAQSVGVTTYELGVLSYLAYNPDNPDDPSLPGDFSELQAAGLQPPGGAGSWEVWGRNWTVIGRSDDILPEPLAAGYFGIAYQNTIYGQVVIAHRGTSGLLDLDDDFGIAIDVEPFQANLASSFTVLIEFMVNPGYTILHTGHSLGANLAEITAEKSGKEAITFDSPGSLSILGSCPNVTSYQGPPNLVNTLNTHCGVQVLVEPNWRELRDHYFKWNDLFKALATLFTKSKGELADIIMETISDESGYWNYTVNDAHSLLRILSQFNTTTGQPIDADVNVDTWWPIGVPAGLMNYWFPDARAPQIISLIAALEESNNAWEFLNILRDYVFADSKKLDLVFVIDTTGSMWDDIDEVKKNAKKLVDKISSEVEDYRVAIIVYRDYTDFNPPAYVHLPFTTGKNTIVDSINTITVGGGGDWPEAVYAALMTANELPWRDGVRKRVILMGDAPAHDPEPYTGHTLVSVSQKAFEVDPVFYYPVLIGNAPDTTANFKALADVNFGEMFYAEGADDIVDTLIEAIGVAAGGGGAVAPGGGGDTSGSYAGPAEIPMCADIDGSTNNAVRADVQPGAVTNGGVYCRMLAENGAFSNPNAAAQIGNMDLINMGVMQAVDVYGMAGATSYTHFNSSVKICLQGAGQLAFLDAAAMPRTLNWLPTTTEGSYTCALIYGAGTVVLVP